MTDSQHQSYYELALTNRQVMVAFVVLLLCIFVAFFSGIWIGRNGQSEPPVEEPVLTAEAVAEDLELGTLEFFSDSGDSKPEKPLEEVAREQRSDTTLLEDVTGKKPASQPEQRPPAPAPARERPKPAAAEPEKPASRLPEAESPSQATTESVPPAVDGLQIQVFSSSDRVQAAGVRDQLLGEGLKAYISSVDVGGRTMHRVRIGPFTERSEADAVAERVRRDFKMDTWITR